MDLTLGADQRMLQDAALRLFASESTPQRVRAAESQHGGFDAALWRQLVELGFATMRTPQGAEAGMGLFDALLVAEAAGAHLASVPLAEALAASSLLSRLDGPQALDWQTRLQDGALLVMAPAEVDADTPTVIPGGAAAEAALLLDGDTVLLLPQALLTPRASLGGAALASIDAATVRARPAGCIELARGPAARRAYQAAQEEWKLLNAAMLAGLAQRALELAAAYARDRQQFGKAIGSFQGIAHPLADALTEIDGARMLAWRAVWALAARPADAAAAISMAWWWAAHSSSRAVARALHTFGGYGVSLEYDIQLHYRRAKAWALPAGDAQAELRRLASRLWSAHETALPEPGPVPVRFGVGPQGEAFANEVRAFFADHLTPELKAHAHHSVDGYHPAFTRKMADHGLLFPHWPAEWGGRGRTPFEMAALAEVFEEVGWQRITAPVTNQVAQIVMRFGSDEVKQEALPRFARAEALGCLGFSEPSSGCDVFSVRTKAVKDGDHWVIDGQKIFTTAGNLADYIFLLTRTDPTLPKHAGLTLFLVPMNLPGIELQPVHTVQDERTNVTYLSNVRVHDRYRIGEVNGGLKVMADTLELEHGGDQYRISYAHMVRQAVQWAQATQRRGRAVIEDVDVRQRLARAVVHTAVAEVLCHRAIWGVSHQVPGRAAWGPMAKVFSTETYLRDATELMDLAAPETLFPGPHHGLGAVELGYRQSIGMTIYGGTSEVQRSLIAEQGLKLPRSRS